MKSRRTATQSTPADQAAPVTTTPMSNAQVHLFMNTNRAANSLAGVRENLAEAIATMRRFLDDTERTVAYSLTEGANTFSPSNAVQNVIHQLAWGNANASTLVQAAMRDTLAYQEATAALAALPKACNCGEGDTPGLAHCDGCPAK